MNIFPYIVLALLAWQCATAAPPLPDPDCGTRPHRVKQLQGTSGLG